MKNLTVKLSLCAFLLLLGFNGCKKQVDDSEPETDQINGKELLNYYIVLKHQNDYPNLPQNQLQIIDFTIYGWDTEVTSRLFNATSYAKHKIVLKDNELKFDVGQDSKNVYSFKLEKDNDGKITISNYQYLSTGDNIAIAYAQIFKKADAPTFKGKVFGLRNNKFSFLKFTPNNIWYWNEYNDFNGAAPIVYYQESPLIWQSKDSKNARYIGVCVPEWKEINEPVMLVDIEPDGFAIFSAIN